MHATLPKIDGAAPSPPVQAGMPHGVAPDRRNSFDAIRMAAAFCVFYSHECGMAGYPEPPLGPLGIALSSTGLYIFFGLSGYLVALSLKREPRPGRFALARVLRIYPAWIVNMVFCVALGAAVTTLPGAAYWHDAETHRFLRHNLPILFTPNQFQLPGVLADARWPMINVSIWTVKYELLCYGLLLGLATLVPARLARPRTVLAVATVAFTALYIRHITLRPNPPGEVFFAYWNSFNLLRFFMTFSAGALYAAAEPVGERTRLAFLLAAGGLITFGPSPHFARAGIVLLLTLMTIELGKTRWLYSRAYRRLGDLSYGTFLYAYPVQNLITTRLFDGHNFPLVVTLSGAGTLACAWLSWHLVERPALRLKERFGRPWSPLVEAQPPM